VDNTAAAAVYSTDLAYVHDAAFTAAARQAGPAVVRLLHEDGIRRGRVVEVGCGSGVLAEYLTDRGYDVTGFDISPAMVRLARARAPRATFHVGSANEVHGGRCHAVIALGELVTYLPGGRAALRRFFRRAHTQLAPGGVLIFDCMVSARRRTFTLKSHGGRDWALIATAAADRSGRVLTRRIAVVRWNGRKLRRTVETHTVRVYSVREIRAALAAAGFSTRVLRALGRHRLLPGDRLIVAQRR
jgi:SAM-dependent methyltransferase